jgi:hypothetical protein
MIPVIKSLNRAVAYALLHAVFGILISVAFGRLYGIMSVGTSYTRRMGNVYKVVDPRN